MVMGVSEGSGAGVVGGDGLLVSAIVVDSIVIGCVFCESSQKKGLGGIGVVEVRIKLFG